MSDTYICRKCRRLHSLKEYNESKFCQNCDTFLSGGKSSLSARDGPTHAEMIADVIKELQEPFSTQQIKNAVKRKFSAIRSIDLDSLGTDIAGCCINLKSHNSLPDLPLILKSVRRGWYIRYEPRKDKSEVTDFTISKASSFEKMK